MKSAARFCDDFKYGIRICLLAVPNVAMRCYKDS